MRQNLFGLLEVVQCRTIFIACLNNWLQLFVLFIQRNEFFDIGNHFGVSHLLPNLFIFDFQAIKARKDRIVRHKVYNCF